MPLPRITTRSLAFAALATLAIAQTTSHVWTGANATTAQGYAYANASDALNWQGNTVPSLGNASSTRLIFGATGNAATQLFFVDLPATRVRGFEFTGAGPNYHLYAPSSLELGAGGIVATGVIARNSIWAPSLFLLSNQTWSVDGELDVGADLHEEDPGTQLTKTGAGTLTLDGTGGSFSGGLIVLNGTLQLHGSSGREGAQINGPVGSGTLTLGDHTTLRPKSDDDDLELHNDIRLGNGVTLGAPELDSRMTLHGNLTPSQTATTLHLGSEGGLFLLGNLTDAAAGASSFTFTRANSLTTSTSGNSGDFFPVAVLSGNNTYTGGTTAQNAGVIFFTPSSLPATGNLLALEDGYLGAGYNGGLAAILARISAPAAFSGALGLDTNPDLTNVPTVFDDAINLAAFGPDTGPTTTGFWGLGSLTFAQLSANSTLTPPNGGNYLFGGGEGTLYIRTNLGVPANSPGAGVRVRTPFGDRPLTVYLQGNNTFTGNILVDHSAVILDSVNALPATAQLGLDSKAYLGFTENAGLTPAQVLARLSNSNADSILGFDHSPANTAHGVTVTDPVNLSALTDIFLGTTTHAHLAGQIRAPSSGVLSLTGLKGGWLTIDSALAPTYSTANGTVSGVNAVRVGLSPANDVFDFSFVELANASSNYGGGTTLQAGFLLVGASSVTSNGTLTSGPLGTGTLTFSGQNYFSPSTVVVTQSTGVILHNPILFNSGALARFGVAPTNDDRDEDPNSTVADFASNPLALAGNLSGFSGGIQFAGSTVFTLSGNNSALHASEITIGTTNQYTTTRVVATTPHALGDDHTPIQLQPTANLQFTSPLSTPVTFFIGTIHGGTPDNYDLFRSHLALDDGDTLNINQNSYGTLYANIGGAPTAWSDNAATPTTAAVIKNGSGTLTLAGDNAFSGGLTINQGGVIAATDTALGSGNVTLNGGKLALADGVNFTNNLSFGAAGGTLGGNATFTTPITVGTNVTLAPGNSPGTLTFTNGLTFSSGGSLSIDIVDLSLGAGSGYDTVNVSGGTFAINATAAQPFTIQINSLSALSNSLGALSTDSSVARSLTLLQAPTTITGLVGDGTAGLSNLVLQTSNFTNFQPGLFSLALGGANNSALVLNFTPVPEPSTYALLGLGLALVGWQLHRRRRAR